MAVQLGISFRVSRRIHLFIKKHSMSTDELADILGIPTTSLRNYTAVRPCTVDVLFRFLLAFPEHKEELAEWLLCRINPQDDLPFHVSTYPTRVEHARRREVKVKRNSEEFCCYNMVELARAVSKHELPGYNNLVLSRMFNVDHKTISSWREGDAPAPLEYLEAVMAESHCPLPLFLAGAVERYVKQQKEISA